MEVRKNIGKTLLTNHSSFELENKGRACYFAISTWLSNFCHGFSNHSGTFSSKRESLLFENRGRRRKKNGGRLKIWASGFMLCQGRPSFIDLF